VICPLTEISLTEPLAKDGSLELSTLDGLDYSLTVGIEQLQLEQDTGKSLHDVYPGETLLDLNRAGTGLMEIVTRPDMRSSKEAGVTVKKLQQLLRTVNSSDGNMDEVIFAIKKLQQSGEVKDCASGSNNFL
jgi:aspartyl-tRNA(Asn)/glutamyl-tRNA(Gln) amidotransferase subunit B